MNSVTTYQVRGVRVMMCAMCADAYTELRIVRERHDGTCERCGIVLHGRVR